jgi:hypothetical protein
MKATVHSLSMAFDLCQQRTSEFGWLSMFMHTINATWPHTDHILINLGIPGHSWHAFAHSVCIEPFLPNHTDLVVLEHLPYLERPPVLEPLQPAGRTAESAEILMHRLQLKFNDVNTFPPTLFLNMHRLLDHSEPNFESVNKCVRSRGELCPTECPNSFKELLETDGENHPVEVESNLLAGHHGMSSLSYVKVWARFAASVLSARHAVCLIL